MRATSHRCWNEGQRCCLQEKNFFFFCCFLLLLLLCFSFLTDLALCICSHNSEVRQRLMASNLVSLAKAWHFHMGHWVNERERGGKRQKLGLCVDASPCPASQLLLACKPWHSNNTKCTVALTEGRGGEGRLCFGWPILSMIVTLIKLIFIYSLYKRITVEVKLECELVWS